MDGGREGSYPWGTRITETFSVNSCPTSGQSKPTKINFTQLGPTWANLAKLAPTWNQIIKSSLNGGLPTPALPSLCYSLSTPCTSTPPCGRGQYLLYHVNVPCSKSHKKTAICNFSNRVFNPASISTKSVLLYFCNRSNFTDFFTPSLRISKVSVFSSRSSSKSTPSRNDKSKSSSGDCSSTSV